MGRFRKVYEKDWKKYLMCSQCWELKEATSEYWHKQTEWRFQSRCKECVNLNMKKYYIDNSDKLKAKSNEYNNNNKDKRKAYREMNKQHIKEHWAEYRKNSESFKEYQKRYEQENKDKIRDRKKNKRIEMWYWAIHLKTSRTIKKLWIRPKICPICWEEKRVEAHHPNNDIWYEIVRACNQCHQRIHNWWIECPKPINLLDYEK